MAADEGASGGSVGFAALAVATVIPAISVIANPDSLGI